MAIFIFLMSDGLAPGEHQRPTVTLHLTDVSGNNHFLGESDSCPSGATREQSHRTRRPLEVSVLQRVVPHLHCTATERIKLALIGKHAVEAA